MTVSHSVTTSMKAADASAARSASSMLAEPFSRTVWKLHSVIVDSESSSSEIASAKAALLRLLKEARNRPLVVVPSVNTGASSRLSNAHSELLRDACEEAAASLPVRASLATLAGANRVSGSQATPRIRPIQQQRSSTHATSMTVCRSRSPHWKN